MTLLSKQVILSISYNLPGDLDIMVDAAAREYLAKAAIEALGLAHEKSKWVKRLKWHNLREFLASGESVCPLNPARSALKLCLDCGYGLAFLLES